jgi:CHASE2 domain-containing sensor protein/predicted Ser/Thr protein kinase
MSRRRATALLAIAVVAAGLAGGMERLGLGDDLELETVDARFRIRGPVTPPDDVVLVVVDEESLSALQQRWPFPRARQARLIDLVAAGKPRAIAIDLQYTERTTDKDDNALIEAIEGAGHVVLATTAVNDQGGTNVLGGDEVVNAIGARVGTALMPLDHDGAIRRAAYDVEGLESFAVVTAEVATNRQVEPFDESRTWIDFAGPPQTMRSYSYSDVLLGQVPPETFRGKIVVVGTSAVRLKDASTTSTTDRSLMSGPEVQANAIATVRSGFPLSSPGGFAAAVLIVLMAAVAPLAAVRLRPLGVAIAGAIAGVAFLAAAQMLFGIGWIVPVVHPLAAWAIGIAGVLAFARTRAAPAALPARAAPHAAGPATAPATEYPVAADVEAPTLADEIAGFRLEEMIGRGGMGVVYRAVQPGLDRQVAVKVIAPAHAADPRYRERFAREARLAAALDHPNIVPVYTTGDDHGQLYLVMRYIDGVNLAERLRAGPLPLASVTEIVSQVASALDAAHERGVIHRDVKPANILLVERDGAPPFAFLTDFGITRDLAATTGMTRAGAFLGSVDYAAPEQAAGAGAAADLYALGCTAYECLTGLPPFGRRSEDEILWAHAHEEPQPPSALVPGLPPEADEAVLRAIAKDPDVRWPSCTAFARELANALLTVR